MQTDEQTQRASRPNKTRVAIIKKNMNSLASIVLMAAIIYGAVAMPTVFEEADVVVPEAPGDDILRVCAHTE